MTDRSKAQKPWHILDILLPWRHNERDGVSNNQPNDCLLNRLFRRRSKKTSKLCVTGLCAGNSPVTGEFPAQKASNGKMFPFDDVIILGLSTRTVKLMSVKDHCILSLQRAGDGRLVELTLPAGRWNNIMFNNDVAMTKCRWYVDHFPCLSQLRSFLNRLL